MRHRFRLISIISILGMLYVAPWSSAPWFRPAEAAFNLTFPKPREVTTIFEVIGTVGNFNVAVDPRVRQKMQLNVKNIEPVEAMYLVARLANLRVKKVEDIKGRPTYVVGTKDLIEEQFEPGLTRSYRLRYAKAEEVAQVLAQGLGKDTNIQVQQDPRTNQVIVAGNEDILNRVDDLIKGLDLPVPQVLIDAKIVTVQTSFTRNLGFVWNMGVNGTANGVVTDDTAGSGPVFVVTEHQRLQPNASQYDSPGPAQGSDLFGFGDFFRGNLFFNSALSALEANGITRTLSSPRLLAINGTEAQLRIGDKIVFSGGPTQPPEERDTGTVMDITPRVNKDNFITMEIKVEQSSARFDRGDFPTITQTSAKTVVQVRDGEEVLVGGLVQENSSPNSIKVPFLSDIPVIKHLFTKKNKSSTSLELVILLTPQVVKQDVPSADTGEVAVSGGVPGTGSMGFDDFMSDSGSEGDSFGSNGRSSGGGSVGGGVNMGFDRPGKGGRHEDHIRLPPNVNPPVIPQPDLPDIPDLDGLDIPDIEP